MSSTFMNDRHLQGHILRMFGSDDEEKRPVLFVFHFHGLAALLAQAFSGKVFSRWGTCMKLLATNIFRHYLILMILNCLQSG